MRLCILATAENVEAIRQVAQEQIPELTERGVELLSIPCSEKGDLPASHYFCNFLVSEEMCEKLLALKNLSIMEVTDNIRKFLRDNDVMIVRKRNV